MIIDTPAHDTRWLTESATIREQYYVLQIYELIDNKLRRAQESGGIRRQENRIYLSV